MSPERLKTLARGRIIDACVIPERHRNEPDIGCPLYVVLAAQRMRAGARPADLSGNSASEIRLRALSVPWICCEIPMPQKIIERSEVAYRRASSRIVSAAIRVTSATFSGV
jgi:hypothetical protein